METGVCRIVTAAGSDDGVQDLRLRIGGQREEKLRNHQRDVGDMAPEHGGESTNGFTSGGRRRDTSTGGGGGGRRKYNWKQ